MSNYRRVRVASATYFLTVNVLDRKRIDLTRPEFRQALREGIKRTNAIKLRDICRVGRAERNPPLL